MNSFYLLKQKRFAPFFSVQFLNAFNDNIFKNAMVLMLTYKGVTEAESGLISGLAAALLITPFFFFSPLAGQIADRYQKSKIIRIIKISEIAIMGLGGLGYVCESEFVLFFSLFLLGTHSAFFGPIKFSILPQSVKEDELVGANAMVELGTFLAILLGTILGGMLSSQPVFFPVIVTMGIAVLGYLFSRQIPTMPAAAPDLKINLNFFRETYDQMRLIAKNRTIFLSILGNSWFWFIGTTVLSQLPIFTKFYLHSDKNTVTLLLASFCISIGLGSAACEWLSRKEIEIGLVPIGAAGISIFCMDLALHHYPSFRETNLLTLSEFWNQQGELCIRVMIDIFGMGFSGALFIIPLNALIQSRSEPQECSRVIAGNNIVNAIFMIAASVFIACLYQFEFTTTQIFASLATINFIVSTYMFFVVPEFTMRFVIWILASTTYRLRYKNRDAIPKKGPAILVCNHVSYLDWFVIAAACRRPVRFVMWYRFFEAPLVRYFFILGKAIPIASSKEDETVKAQAFRQINERLNFGSMICIFPEGTLTSDGNLLTFRNGIEEIQKNNPGVPVVPMALRGLWGSFFSHYKRRTFKGIPKPSRRVIEVLIGEPIQGFTSAVELQEMVNALYNDGENSSAKV